MLNRYPLLAAVMLQMDCSGGFVYTDGDTVAEGIRMAIKEFGQDAVNAAEQHLEQYTGTQLQLIALASWVNDEGPKPDENTEHVLGYVFEVA